MEDSDIAKQSSVGAISDGGPEIFRFLVMLESDEDGWEVASCPALPGCHSQGRTRKEAMVNIRGAIKGYLASMREDGIPIPDSRAYEVVEVTA